MKNHPLTKVVNDQASSPNIDYFNYVPISDSPSGNLIDGGSWSSYLQVKSNSPVQGVVADVGGDPPLSGPVDFSWLVNTCCDGIFDVPLDVGELTVNINMESSTVIGEPCQDRNAKISSGNGGIVGGLYTNMVYI